MGKSIVRALIGTLVLLTLAEGVCWLFLRSTRRSTYPFLVGRHPAIPSTKNNVEYGHLDPNLGYGLVPPFTKYGRLPDEAKPLRIVALGGSTTDPTLQPGNWPEQLQVLLEQRGIANVVFNGGVGGYSSSQEVIKLLRDVPALKPDVVISLNGINDNGAHSEPGHPMVHQYQASLFRAIVSPEIRVPFVLPNTIAVLLQVIRNIGPPELKITLGSDDAIGLWEQWKRNVRTMHAIASEFGFEYLCFLQPSMGLGRYDASAQESNWLGLEDSRQLLEMSRSLYKGARPACQSLSYCVDIVDIFQRGHELYDDPRHPNRRGNQVIAERVVQEIQSRRFVR
jgi:lysophospholipase L1-like esterase